MGYGVPLPPLQVECQRRTPHAWRKKLSCNRQSRAIVQREGDGGG
jgi:hypothetical protein